MSKLIGKVVKVKSEDIEINGTEFVKNIIYLDAGEGETLKIEKYTKPETNFKLAAGTKVQINVTEREGKYGTVYKVDSKPENLVLLDQKKGDLNTASSKDSYQNKKTSEYDPNGAKRGNALTNATSLLIHSKGKEPVTSKDASKLLELARMVYSVSTELESPPKAKIDEASIDEEETTPFD